MEQSLLDVMFFCFISSMRNLRKASAWPSDEFGLYPITTRLLDPRSPTPSGSVTHRTVQVGPPSSNRDTLHNITALLTTTNRLHNRPLVMDDLWKSRRRIKNAGNKRHRKKDASDWRKFLYHIILNSLNQFKRYSKIFHFQNLSQIREDFFSKKLFQKNNYFFFRAV